MRGIGQVVGAREVEYDRHPILRDLLDDLPRLRALARTFARNHSDAHDLVQATGTELAWKAMQTADQGADGALGGNDADADPSHPISVVHPATGRALGMSADDLINALNDLLLLAGVFDGSDAVEQALDHRDDAPSVTNLSG